MKQHVIEEIYNPNSMDFSDKLILNCETFETTLETSSKIVGVSEEKLLNFIKQERHNEYGYEDMFNAFKKEFGIESIDYDGAFFFHMTRIDDGSCFFRDGLMPLPKIIDKILSAPHSLNSDIPIIEFKDVQNHLFQKRIEGKDDWACSALIPEELLGSSFLTEGGEMYQDLFKYVEEKYGIDLSQSYLDSTRETAVKLYIERKDSEKKKESDYSVALNYLHSKCDEYYHPSYYCNSNMCCEDGVPSERVVKVSYLNYDESKYKKKHDFCAQPKITFICRDEL